MRTPLVACFLRQGGHARIYAFHHLSGLLVPHPTRYIFDYRASYLDAIHSVHSVSETYQGNLTKQARD